MHLGLIVLQRDANQVAPFLRYASEALIGFPAFGRE